MKRQPSPHVYLTRELNDRLQKLGPKHKFSKWVRAMKETLAENIFAGELIRKNQIPRFYTEKYGVNNLYRYSHPEGYRSCYTVVRGCPWIFDLMSHSEYDKVFGYRTT
jgi:hypothetical protein